MLRPYDLLEQVLTDIEKGIKGYVNGDSLAKKYGLSEGHLRRLFRFAFRQSIAGYIRSRKLSASIGDLLKTDANLIDIALDYGFGYEQTYLRSFKREFGITPGDLRKSGKILKIKPPLHLFDENKIGDSLLFGPDFVVVPQFHVVGKRYCIAYGDPILAQQAAVDFWENEHKVVSNVKNPEVFIGMTREGFTESDYRYYLPSVQVSSHEKIPEGFCSDTFDTSLCARFRYIGQHHYYNINRINAEEMYKAISKFKNDEQARYTLADDKVYFERINPGHYDGKYCLMEWFAPVVENIKEKSINVRK